MNEYYLGFLQILTNIMAADKSSKENVTLANDMANNILSYINKQVSEAIILKSTDIQIVQEIN